MFGHGGPGPLLGVMSSLRSPSAQSSPAHEPPAAVVSDCCSPGRSSVPGALSRALCPGSSVPGALSRELCPGRSVTGALSRALCHVRSVTCALSRELCPGRNTPHARRWTPLPCARSSHACTPSTSTRLQRAHTFHVHTLFTCTHFSRVSSVHSDPCKHSACGTVCE